MYNQAKGWYARGSKWASETEQKQFDEMDFYFKKVIHDLDVALKKNKQVLISYYALLSMMRTSADNKGILQVLQAALAINPNTYHVRRAAMYSLWLLAKQRDWNQIIDYWDQHIARNPDDNRAYVERGGAYYHKGDMHSAVNDAKTAADMGNVEGKEAK